MYMVAFSYQGIRTLVSSAICLGDGDVSTSPELFLRATANCLGAIGAGS